MPRLDVDGSVGESEETISSTNSIRQPSPLRLTLPAGENDEAALGPQDFVEFKVALRAPEVGVLTLGSMLTFREVSTKCLYFQICANMWLLKSDQDNFHSAYTKRVFDVRQLLDISVSARPSTSSKHTFCLDVEVQNASSNTEVRLDSYSTISPGWRCQPASELSW